jgi:hypothetical protein
VTAPASVVVYDNTTETLGPDIETGPPQAIGNEVTLAGTARTVTEFQFNYYGGPNVLGTLRFYANDGHAGAPKTLLFDSGPFTVDVGQDLEKTLSGLHVHVPDTFTWMLSYTNHNEDDSLALLCSGPPSVGTCKRMWLQSGTGFWPDQYEISPGHKGSGLNARITAVTQLPHATWPEQIVAQVLTGVINDGGGIVLVGGHIVKVPPREPLEAILASLPSTLVQRLKPLLEAPPTGDRPEATLRQQLSQVVSQYQKEFPG